MSPKNVKKQYIAEGERHCRELGYTKCGANWYRCYGQGLLQTVTFQGVPERVNDTAFTREAAVLFEVYSLFNELLWIPFPIMGKRRDLFPHILPSAFLLNMPCKDFLGTAYEAECMNTHGFSFLNQINTHAQLAAMLEKLGASNSEKAVPYLLAGELQKSIDCINEIERQNMNAYHQERLRKTDAENEQELQKILSKLQPLLALREGVYKRNSAEIIRILSDNYQTNVEHLLNMGIPIPDSATFSADLQALINLG